MTTQMTTSNDNPDDNTRWKNQMTTPYDNPSWQPQMTTPDEHLDYKQDDNPRWWNQMTIHMTTPDDNDDNEMITVMTY
jgi:hypothetical protein